MTNRKWILKFATALLFTVVGLSAYAADNNLTASAPNTHLLGSDNVMTTSAPNANLLANEGNLAATSAANNLLGSSANNNLTAGNGDSAVDLTNSKNVYADVPNDYSIKYLNMLFGNVGGTLRGSVTGQTVGHLFYIFNQGILIACGVWVLLTLFRILSKLIDGNVQEISKEGKTFLSICLGIVLVIPSPRTGYSTIQDIIMKVVVQGVKLANGIWNYQINAFENHVHVFDNPPQQVGWVNSSEVDKDGRLETQYQYYHIMASTIPNRVDKGLYNILNAEINYYKTKINCENNGSDACGSDPHPLIANTGPGSTNNSTITLNQSYPEASSANPVTFTAEIKLSQKAVQTDNDDTPHNINPFGSNLEQVAGALKGTAMSFACQSSPDSPSCANTPPVDLTNSANMIIGVSTDFANNIKDVYGLDQLQNDPITNDDAIETDGQQCKARWQNENEINAKPTKEQMDKYNEEMAQYEANKQALQDKINALEDSDIYKKYSDGIYSDDYQKMQNEGCHALMSCNMNSKDYMKVGDVGGWGKEDGGGSGPDDYNARLQNCMDWIKTGRRAYTSSDVNGIGGYADGVTEKDGKYYGKDGKELTDGLSNNVGDALYPDATDDQRRELCQKYGSILYQVWRDNDALNVHEGMSAQDKKDFLDQYLPNQEELNGFTPPKYPTINRDDDKTGAVSCTKVLADKMRSSGWIMAGAYYWLIAHQDQQMVSLNSAKSEKYIDWSVGKKLALALAAFSLSHGDDNNGSGGATPGGDDSDNSTALKNASCDKSADGATVDNLQSCVLMNTKQQFRDNGADIGQINTQDTSGNGISAQLAWAGSAFNAIISGESESIDSAPRASSVKDETQGYSSTSSSMGKYGQSALGVLYKAQASLFPQLMNQVYYMQKFILNVASQLNNPNLDPQSIIASIGMGMIYQGGYATLGYVHMMITLVIVVIIGVVIIAVLMCIPFGIGGVAAAVTGAPLAMLMTFAKVMGGILRKIGVTFMAMGAVMAFYVPIYPWIVFTFAAVGWFIAVIESMAAGPLICLGMTHPQGQELASSLKQSVMLLLSVFIRPALIVLSFIMSMILARVLLFFMIQGFLMLLGTLYDSNSNDYCRYIFNTADLTPGTDGTLPKAKCDGGYGTSINLWSSMFNLSAHAADIAHEQYSDTIKPMDYNVLNNDSNALNQNIPYAYQTNTAHDGRPDAAGYKNVMQFIMMMLSMPILLGILTYMTYKIINHAYSLVFLVPENVLKWIGAQSAGNTQQLMQSVEGAKGAASKASQGASKGATKSMQVGEAQATSASKAGASAGIQAGGEGIKAGAKGKKK
jgi:hypothetical protein